MCPIKAIRVLESILLYDIGLAIVKLLCLVTYDFRADTLIKLTAYEITYCVLGVLKLTKGPTEIYKNKSNIFSLFSNS